MANNIKGITIEIDGNTTKLSKALSDVNKDIKSTQTALKDVNKLLELDPKNTVLLEQKQRLLADAVSKTKDKLDLLKTAQEQASEALAKGDIGQDEYDALTRQIISTENELSNYEAQAEDANNAIDMSDSEADMESAGAAAGDLAKDVDKVGDNTEETGGIWGSIWSKMDSAVLNLSITDVIGTITDALGDMVDQLHDAIQEYDEAEAKIAEGTGATGRDLEQFTTVAQEALKQVDDANLTLEDMANIVGEANTRFGTTGDELEDFSVKVANFAKVTGGEGTDAVDMIADNVRQWGDECLSTDELMDDLVYTAQACGASADELGSALSDNAYQFQQLGMSQEEALELMAKVAWTGGEVSDVTSGMNTAFTKLNGKVEDVPGTLQLAIDQLEAWDGKSNVLNETIGDTGLTMEDVFGKKAATMAQALSTAAQETESFSFNLDDADGRMNQTSADATTLDDSVSTLKKTMSTDISQGVRNSLETTDYAVDWLGYDMSDLSDTIEDTSKDSKKSAGVLKSAWTKTMNDVSSYSDTASMEVASAFAAMSSSASSETSKAYSTTKTNMSKIKSTTSFSWSLPKLKLPHFKVTGSWNWNPPTIPHFSVSWYKKAYQNAYALDGAQIFGSMGGSALAGGENGRELILGEDYFNNAIANAIRNAGGTSNTFGNTVINVYGAEGQNVSELANIIEDKITMNIKRRTGAW